jgi:hypothetical protein
MLMPSIILVGLAAADDFEVSRSTIDGGGPGAPGFSSGAGLELAGTVGQPDAGILSGGDFELSGGFWFPLTPTDCNVDGSVDLLDHADLEPCLSGPEGGLLFPGCNCFDVDGDIDVDLSDVARFQTEFMG